MQKFENVNLIFFLIDDLSKVTHQLRNSQKSKIILRLLGAKTSVWSKPGRYRIIGRN